MGDEISFTMVRYMNSINRMLLIFVISIPYICSYTVSSLSFHNCGWGLDWRYQHCVLTIYLLIFDICDLINTIGMTLLKITVALRNFENVPNYGAQRRGLENFYKKL